MEKDNSSDPINQVDVLKIALDSKHHAHFCFYPTSKCTCEHLTNEELEFDEIEYWNLKREELNDEIDYEEFEIDNSEDDL